MRAHTITTMTRRRRNARRRVIALVLGVCALAIPATTSAQPIDPPASVPTDSVQPPHGADYSSVAITGSDTEGSALVASSPADSSDGLDLGDAALGAGAAMALVALGGAVLVTIRRRPGVSPSASTS